MTTITYGTLTNGKQASQVLKEKRAQNFTNSLRDHVRRNSNIFQYTV